MLLASLQRLNLNLRYSLINSQMMMFLPVGTPELRNTHPCLCCGWSLFVPVRHFSRVRFPPDRSVTEGSVINNIKLWTSGRWYNVPTDSPTALAGASSPSVLPPLEIMISSLCDWVPSLISWVCWRVFLMGPSPGTHARSGRPSDTTT